MFQFLLKSLLCWIFQVFTSWCLSFLIIFPLFLLFSFNIFLEYFVVGIVFVVFILIVCLSYVGSWDSFLTFFWVSFGKKGFIIAFMGQFTDDTILGQVKRKSESQEMILPEFCEFPKSGQTWSEPCIYFASTPDTSSSTGLVIVIPESSCYWESQWAQVALLKSPMGESAV